MDQQQAVSQASSNAQTPQASLSQAVVQSSSAQSVILSTAATPTSITTLPFSGHNAINAHNSSVNILAGGQHGHFQTQTQTLPQGLLQQPIQVIQQGQALHAGQFQFMQQPIMLGASGLYQTNPLAPYGYQLLSGAQSAMPLNAGTPNKLPIMSKNSISISPANATGQLFTGNLKTSTQTIQIKPPMLSSPFSTQQGQTLYITNPNNFLQPHNIISQPTTVKGLDHKNKNIITTTIQPKPPISTASIMHKPTHLNQTIIPQHLLSQQQLQLQFPQGIWASSPQVIGGGVQPMYITQTPQHQALPLVAQSGHSTVQVMPTAAPQQAPQIIQTATPTSSAKVAITSANVKSGVGTNAQPKPASKQILPRPPGATQTAQKTGTADASRGPVVVQQQLTQQQQFKQQVQKSSPNLNQAQQSAAAANKSTAQTNLNANTKPTNPQQQQQQQQQNKTPTGTPNRSQHPTKGTGASAVSQKSSVSMGSDTRTGPGPQQHNKSEQPLKPPNNNNSTKLSVGSGPGERTMASTKQQQQNQIDRQNAAPRKVEKRDASTQETELLKGGKYHEQSNGLAKRPKAEERPATRNGGVPPVEKKPLIHVIGDYVIEESSTPFPVNGDLNGCTDFSEAGFRPEQNGQPEIAPVNGHHTPEPPVAKKVDTPATNGTDTPKCQLCQKNFPRSKTKLTKNNIRLCASCYKKQSSSNRLALFNSVTCGLNNLSDADFTSENNSRSSIDTDRQSIESDLSDKRPPRKSTFEKAPVTQKAAETKNAVNGMAAPAKEPVVLQNTNNNSGEDFIPKSGPNPNNWTVTDVYDFIMNLTGSAEDAEKFKSQEVDGQALMLIEMDHMMTNMQMKLGPALKISKKIKALNS